MKLVLIKYNAGNIQSVLYALERLGAAAEVTDDPEKISSADKVIFPGVGEASSAMHSLREKGLDAVIRDLKQPVLGICVGMQLLCRHSEENDTECLGIVPVQVRRFQPLGGIKVPQVGWNQIYGLQSPLFSEVPEGSYIYNVHSYFADDSPYTIGKCHYGVEYAAAVQRDNFYGVQFHTEKSAENGDRILKNFIDRVS
ncbi:MAG TPA: imidazole glycerol phosphate synthase subunit HisH [Chitinophagaceae bacterium]|jgi:glutamine amidotransferase|nr:imidazole glycerol phosphate synthase subunit HisH [Chitinophagaceae bacterium]